MDKKTTKTQLEHLFGILTSSDIFTISSSERYQRLLGFFNTFRTLKAEILKHPKAIKTAELKWKVFHEKLCDVECHGESINTFLSKMLNYDDAFVDYSVYIIEAILECNLHDEELHEKLSTEADQRQLIKTLKENCDNVPSKVCYKYLHLRVLPAIFSAHTSELERKELCELVMALPLGFAYPFMSTEVQLKFKEDAIDKYIPFLKSYCFNKDWRQMCKVLIYYSGKLLHIENSLTNEILKIVETAFKNRTIVDRCSAYECWKVLIDNYSLEKKYITHSKQAVLLLKPLKAKISRNRLVAVKKFDTYVHLMQKMDFAKDYLEKFFSSAFGPFEEEICDFIVGDNIYNLRDINSTCPKSTEILLKILAHDKEHCNCSNKNLPITNIFEVKNPTAETYNWEVLVNSVRLCSQVNFNWHVGDNRETVVKCLWSSLYKLSLHENYKPNYAQNLKSIQLAIAKILNCSYMSTVYYDTFFKYILKAMVNYLDDVGFILEVYNELVIPTIRDLIIFQNNYPEKLPSNIYEDVAVELILYCRNDESFFSTINILMDSEVYKCQLASDIFVFALDHFAKTLTRNGKDADGILNILMTNIISINSNPHIVAPDFSRDIDKIVRYNSGALTVLFDTLLNNNSQWIFGIYKIASTFIRNTIVPKSVIHPPFYNHLLDIIVTCITQIELDRPQNLNDLQDASVALEKSLKYIVDIRENNSKLNIESQKLFDIYTGLLKLEVYSVLDSLATLLEWTVKKDVPSDLYNLISSLTDKEEVSQKAFIVFAKIHSASSSLSPSDNASAKHKVKILSNTVIPTVSPKIEKTVRLFGKYLDSPSPKRLKESILERTKGQVKANDITPSKTSTAVKNIEEYSESAFVVSDKEVIVNAHKFNEHQKEMAKKRREDIPALYSDLTQSQSQSLDQNNAMKDMENTKIEFSPKTLLQNLNGNGNNVKDDTHTKDKTFKQETTDKNHTSDSVNASPKEIENIKPNSGNSFASTNKRRSLRINSDGYLSVQNRIKNDEATDNGNENANDVHFRELARLRMDIVGGSDFYNLPRARPRKMRKFEDSVDPDMLFLLEEPLQNSKTTENDNEMELTASLSENCDRNEDVDPKKEDETQQGKTDEKPRRTSTDLESENIIPATQDVEVRVNLFRLPALSPTRKELNELNVVKSLKDKSLRDNNIKKSCTVVTKIDFCNSNEDKPDEQSKDKNTDVVKKHKIRDSISKKSGQKRIAKEHDGVKRRKKIKNTDKKNNDTKQAASIKVVDETLTLDLISEVGNSNIAEMETESFLSTNSSLHLTQETPTKTSLIDVSANNSLMSSPITPDTPSRTKELLNDTLDISPIRTETPAVHVSPDLFVDDTQSEQNDDAKINYNKPEETSTLKSPSTRSAKLLNLIGQSPKITATRSAIENSKVLNISSPKTDRIKKMMLSCAEENQDKDEGQPLEKLNSEKILEFNRPVPSPLALPRSSILKRKMSELGDEGMSPCPKRKRVNFPDPPTTSQMLYFKVDEEKCDYQKNRKSTSKKLNPENDESEYKNNDACNAIKSMQNQIDELDDFDGVAPLDSSPVKESNSHESALASNEPPEVVASGSSSAVKDLFPNVFPVNASESRKNNDIVDPLSKQQIAKSAQMKIFDAMLEVAEECLSSYDYVKMCNKKVPIEMLEKYLKMRKLEQRKSKRKRTRRNKDCI